MPRLPLLPPTLSNDYDGPRPVVWVFVFLTAVTVLRSIIHIVAPDGGAASIATIPLSTFTANGAATVIHLFGLWGLSQLVVGLVYVVALVRYRSMIPLLYLLAFVEYAVRLLLAVAKPIALDGTAPGGVANWVLVPVLAVLFVVSLRRTR